MDSGTRFFVPPCGCEAATSRAMDFFKTTIYQRLYLPDSGYGETESWKTIRQISLGAVSIGMEAPADWLPERKGHGKIMLWAERALQGGRQISWCAFTVFVSAFSGPQLRMDGSAAFEKDKQAWQRTGT